MAHLAVAGRWAVFLLRLLLLPLFCPFGSPCPPPGTAHFPLYPITQFLLPRPHLCRVKHPTNFSGPGSLIGGGGLARVPAALPMALLLQPCNLGTAFPPHLAPRLPLFQKARLHGTLTAKPRSLTAPPVKGLHRPGTLQARAQWAERLPKV